MSELDFDPALFGLWPKAAVYDGVSARDDEALQDVARRVILDTKAEAVSPLDDLQAMSAYVPGGDITYYGLFTADGTLGILAGHNNDLANFWDWYADGAMPLKPSTDAFRMGTNAVIYSITH